jgi:predicted nucleic acid-binding protein
VIFLDANVFLRFLTAPVDGPGARMKGQARDLFHAVRAGTTGATTTELVIHEVCYVLTSKKHYGLAHHEAIRLVRPLLRFRSLKLASGERQILLRAFEIWEGNPKLEFSDSVIAARCEANGWELATFDEQLGSLPNVSRWMPEPAA